ncbi:FG-GAP repeat domain-containing protein [Streptomyces sp. NPDC056160]|uniref:FG-GAP repeat domain-containing protein n=1 Tax=Streptomyces sp. NPDC056160 TaxID=3345731 RepID=UPI0035D79855
MPHPRPAARRLALAVTAVLAATLGATSLTAPATAAPATATPAAAVSGSAASGAEGTTAAGAAAQSNVAFPSLVDIAGATATGLLTWDKMSRTYSWTRTSDGSSTKLPGIGNTLATGSGDLVALQEPGKALLRDMSTGRNVLEVDLASLPGHQYAGAAGNALFVVLGNAATGQSLEMRTEAGGATAVTGLPSDARDITVKAGTPVQALVTFSTGTSARHWGFLDLATGTVTETYDVPAAAVHGDVAVSGTHLAWVEYDDPHRPGIAVRTRGTDTIRRFSVGVPYTSDIKVGLVGDWLTYGEGLDIGTGSPDPLDAWTAYNLADGSTHKLLDHMVSAATAPDGTQYVRGGTVAQGEGVYRVAPGTNGVPAARMVASTGEPTKLTLVGHDIPAVIDLDRNRGRVKMSWRLSRKNAEVTVTLRHVRTGKTDRTYLSYPDTPGFEFEWAGELGNRSSGGNGDYTWELSARPTNGIGPTLTASGKFKVVRKPAPHDYNDNGSPDVLARDSSGRLWRSDTYYDPDVDVSGHLSEPEHKLVGGGWNAYDQIEAAGNVGGSTAGDLVARDTHGVLWLYLGKGDGTFAARTRIGAGWGVYNKITGGGDLDNDGKAALLATDTSGALWWYRGTGKAAAPYAARVKVGSAGWNTYNQITAVGNVGGSTAGDLVARDTHGVLWLYLGKGDGTFAARTRIGGGWGAYGQIVGIGDGDRDGRPDLFTYGPGSETYFYPGTGDSHAPFRARRLTGLFFAEPGYNSVV